MGFEDIRLRSLVQHGGTIDTRSALAELDREIEQVSRFSAGALGDFRLIVRNYASRAMTAKDRALFRLTTTLASGCETCIADALVRAVRRGASRSEVKSALARGVLMADRPALIFAGEALAHYDAVKLAGPLAQQEKGAPVAPAPTAEPRQAAVV